MQNFNMKILHDCDLDLNMNKWCVDGNGQNFGPIVITIPKKNQIGGKVRK